MAVLDYRLVEYDMQIQKIENFLSCKYLQKYNTLLAFHALPDILEMMKAFIFSNFMLSFSKLPTNCVICLCAPWKNFGKNFPCWLGSLGMFPILKKISLECVSVLCFHFIIILFLLFTSL